MLKRLLVIPALACGGLVGLCTAALLNGDFETGTTGSTGNWVASYWHRDGAAWNDFDSTYGRTAPHAWMAWDVNPTRVYQDFNLGAGAYTLNFWANFFPAFQTSPSQYFRAEIKTMPVQTVLLLADVTAALVAGQEPNNSTWKGFTNQFVVPAAGQLRITFYAGGLQVPGSDNSVIVLDDISITP